jgi:hypothetical protein
METTVLADQLELPSKLERFEAGDLPTLTFADFFPVFIKFFVPLRLPLLRLSLFSLSYRAMKLTVFFLVPFLVLLLGSSNLVRDFSSLM